MVLLAFKRVAKILRLPRQAGSCSQFVPPPRTMSSRVMSPKDINLNNARNIVVQTPIYWYHEVDSTMDTIREYLKATPQKHMDIFSVVAQRQTKGRGTRGRTWMHGSNNLLMTVAIKRALLPIPLHLLPLRVGTIIASCVSLMITSDAILRLKWPNDILINNNKVCGILIEMEGDHMLIGIGCNVMTAPEVASLGAEAGRTSTALYLHNSEMEAKRSHNDSQTRDNPLDPLPRLNDSDYHELLAIRIVQSFHHWLEQKNDDAQSVITEFAELMDISEQQLRDIQDPLKNKVQPIRLNQDGTLQVRYLSDGSEDCLVADYLW